GLADSLTLKQAQYTMEQTKAMIPNIEAALEQTKNALAILTGELPGTLEAELSLKGPIPALEDREYIGIPANAIRQRPDIRRAERLLAAQLARKKSAPAALWPKFYLTGSIGTEAGGWGSLFEGPAKLYGFMPQISWPIFHAGAIRNNIKVQGAVAEQLLNGYEQSVLTAVGEVRDALSANVREYERNGSLKRGMEAAQAAKARRSADRANDALGYTCCEPR
uniref:TolC family protein n=1 Tax=Alistipes indistinctus TaxID=626932 RepID=UPI003AB8B580